MEVYVARQPIFNAKQEVFAYELLFRNGFKNYYDHLDGDQATSSVLHNSFLTIGMDSLTRGTRAFVNFTRNLLLSEVATLFPKDQMVIEILETVEPEREIIAACTRLKKSGFTLVLDDFVFEPRFQPLIDLADIIKIDFLATPPAERKNLIRQFGTTGRKFLAEKVETQEEYKQAIDMGYAYFQGYFFSKPVIVSAKEVPGYKLNFLQILREVNRPELDFNKLESIIKRDISISYKLLKFINSAAFGVARRVESLKQAMVLLGSRELRKWVSLIVLSNIGKDKPEELVVTSLLRARFLELLASTTNLAQKSADLFLLGLFSQIDAFMDRPKEEILKELPISELIKGVLLGEDNIYKPFYELVISYENADWKPTEKILTQLQLSQEILPALYLESLAWTNQIFAA